MQTSVEKTCGILIIHSFVYLNNSEQLDMLLWQTLQQNNGIIKKDFSSQLFKPIKSQNKFFYALLKIFKCLKEKKKKRKPLS